MNGPAPGGEGGAAEEKSDALKTPSVAADGELESFGPSSRSSRGKRKPIITDGHAAPRCDSLEKLPPTLKRLRRRQRRPFFLFHPLRFPKEGSDGRSGHAGRLAEA